MSTTNQLSPVEYVIRVDILPGAYLARKFETSPSIRIISQEARYGAGEVVVIELHDLVLLILS